MIMPAMRRVALALVLCCLCAAQDERTYGETYSGLDEEASGPPGRRDDSAPGTTAYDRVRVKEVCCVSVYTHSSSQTMRRYAPASPAHATCEACMETT
jgi:hypothetical protein